MVYTNRRTLKRTLLGSTSIDWHYAQTKVSSVSVHAKLRSKVYYCFHAPILDVGYSAHPSAPGL